MDLPQDAPRCRGHWSDQAWLCRLCEECELFDTKGGAGWYVEPAIKVDKLGRMECELRREVRRCEP